MSDWLLYEKLLRNGRAATKRETAINDAVNSLASGIVDDPAYQEDAQVNGETTPIVASRSSTIRCDIKAAPKTDIHIGDMVECLGETWIIVELYTDKIGFINGVMWLCNNVIGFQNRSADIHKRHCIVDDGTYSKQSSDRDAVVMTNTYKIYITLDEETRKLYVDKRLAFGKVYSADGGEVLEVYKIIGMDVKSKNFGEGSHLMVLTIQRDVYDVHADSLEDNLCDVFIDTNESVSSITGSCTILGRDTLRLGVTRTYTAKFTNNIGNEADNVSAAWSVSAPDSIKYTADGNKLAIEVPFEEQLIGELITITVTDVNGRFGACEKKVQVVSIG